jgi:hypothetical protein
LYKHARLVGFFTFDEDYYRCAMSLRSELRLIRTLLKLKQEVLVSHAQNIRPGLSGTKSKVDARIKDPFRSRKNAASSLVRPHNGWGVGAHGMIYLYRVVPIQYLSRYAGSTCDAGEALGPSR